MSKIYTVVVTYNGEVYIEKCLQSLFLSNYLTKIIVIDNASIDKTSEIIEKKYPEIILVRNKKNVGFGAANNQGIKYAIDNNADFVFLLNQDATIYPETIGKLINTSNNFKNFGVISPIHLNGDGTLLDQNFSYYIAYNNNKELLSNFIVPNAKHKEIYEVPFVNAAAWLIPINIIKEVGGFADIFFYRGEDDNLCNRMIFHNYKVGVVPNSFICHDRICSDKNKNQSEEISLLVKLSNPNSISETKLFFDTKVINLKRIIKSQKFKFKFNSANYYKKQLELIIQVYNKAKECYEITRHKGMHYL